MSNYESNTYVAPPEPPSSRRPPAREVGVLGWLNHNLFSNWRDTVITLVTTILTIFIAIEAYTWSVYEAQWEIAFLNLRQVAVGGTFPQSELWRVSIAFYIATFLLLMLVGYWGNINRVVLGILATIAVLTLIIPIATQNITPHPIYYYADATKIDQVNFVGTEGETITFTLDPLTTPEEFDVEGFSGGVFIGNDNSLGNTSWTLYSTATQQVTSEQLDPSNYDLNLAIQVWDKTGEPLATSDFSRSGDDIVTLDFTPSESGWYTFTMIRDEASPGTAGSAWLRVENLDIFWGVSYFANQRQEKYGDAPELDCSGCGTKLNRTDLRFQGTRNISQWFAFQLAPFLELTRNTFFLTLIFAAIGFGVGRGALIGQIPTPIVMRVGALLWIAGLIAWYLLIKGGYFGFSSIRTREWGGIMLTIIFTVIPLIASFPLGIMLALGRRSDLPAVSVVSTAFIEVFRGVPLITLLFLGLYIVQYFADFMATLDLAIRLIVVLTFFTAAYLAEVIRGGLQIIPKGQLEAASAVGLNEFWTNILIVLPQALRAVIPAILGQFLSLFKDTSLVALIGLFEITGSMKIILGDNFYRQVGREGWIFVFIIYFLLSYTMAEVSRKLEETGSGAVRRKQI